MNRNEQWINTNCSLPDKSPSSDIWTAHNSLATALRVMLPKQQVPSFGSMSADPATGHDDVRNVSDDRISTSATHHLSGAMSPTAYDDGDNHPKSPMSSKQDQTWQARSPQDVGKESEDEEEVRNMPSPSQQQRNKPVEDEADDDEVLDARHHRNLSAQFFRQTSITEAMADDRAQLGNGGGGGGDNLGEDDAPDDDRKHRRMYSNGLSHPPVAHRRIDSRGGMAAVPRYHDQQHHHHRNDSGGLDMLAAQVQALENNSNIVVGAAATGWESQEAPAAAAPPTADATAPLAATYAEYPAPSPALASMSGAMHPPSLRQGRYRQQASSSYGHQPTTVASVAVAPTATVAYGQYPSAGAAAAAAALPPSQYYGVQHAQTLAAVADSVAQYPTQQYVGGGGGRDYKSRSRTRRSHDEVMRGSFDVQQQQQQQQQADYWQQQQDMAHQRQLSSLNNLGLSTLLQSHAAAAAAAFASVPHHAPPQEDPNKASSSPHHRVSSSVSFLGDLGLDGPDAAFLRNLQASTGAANVTYTAPMPPTEPSMGPAITVPAFHAPPSETKGSKLASGGTSKRVRRKCIREGCQNRVVQGGLCIAHGAKRKQCKHPGCNKNVKKAGLCSTHGPSRKRCDHEGCEKVAVQGGRCISHGAKKKLCSVQMCSKQAILSGMCKKHHDQFGGSGSVSGRSSPSDEVYGGRSRRASQEVRGNAVPLSAMPTGYPTQQQQQMVRAHVGVGNTNAHKAHHTRGLSIFQEMSADNLKSLLNDPNAPPPPSQAAAQY